MTPDQEPIDEESSEQIVAKLREAFKDEAQELLPARILVPGMPLDEPEGMGEVMQREHRLDAVATEDVHDLLVMGDGVLVPSVLVRLDPAPFDREAVGVNAQVLQEPQVFLVQFVVVRYSRMVPQGCVKPGPIGVR